jgi:hypothetical protein
MSRIFGPDWPLLRRALGLRPLFFKPALADA